MSSLIIVESPTKAKTLSRFLGKEYVIDASMGHIRDLPKSTLGIDLEHDFEPMYEVAKGKSETISRIKSEAKAADRIILATDPDREGEAIAYHITQILPKTTTKGKKLERIVFHEITKEAIEEALANPRTLDDNLVSAQTARRVLDRLVGYKLSPLLWRKVRRGLSAGRVQSVAVRVIVEREREIEKFNKSPYWTITSNLTQVGKTSPTEFELIEIDKKKIEIKEKLSLYDGEYTYSSTIIDSQEKADEIVKKLTAGTFIVADVLQKESKRSPLAPFTTSTLQQEASRRFGYSSKRTMSLAQQLYEEGYITYHRTDSVSMAKSAVESIRSFIGKEYGAKYVAPAPRTYATKQKLAQEAHEAIRPTKPTVSQDQIEFGPDHKKVYDLIWKRAVATQMADAILESTTVIADNNEYRFKATGSVIVFEGFLKLYPQALTEQRLPQFTTGETLTAKEVIPVSHETSPPPRYNEASLIQTLEEKGIGRPSTYAPIISTIQDRAYVEKEEGRFKPTSVGMAVNDFLVANFTEVVDTPFTAEIEDSLDEIAQGKRLWPKVIGDFYKPFDKKVESAGGLERVKIAVEETDEKCPTCGAPLIIRTGRFGKFLACSKFPECKFTKAYAEEVNIPCPKDGGQVVVKKTKKGRKFFGCSNYPKCMFAAWKLEDIKQEAPLEKESSETPPTK